MSRINTQLRSYTVPFGGGATSAVARPTAAYEADMARWELIDDLLGGTDRMRFKGEQWLPRETHETLRAFRTRLARTFLFNGYRDTVEGLVSRPFSRAVTLTPDTLGNAMLDDIADDADREGRNLTQLARELFKHGVTYGRAHVYVDYPPVAPTATLADERSEQHRPYIRIVHPHDLIGWRSETDRSGIRHLTQVRIRETREESDGAYGTKTATYIRVVNAPTAGAAGTWELYCVEGDAARSTPVETGTHTYDGIPLFTAYFQQTGFMMSEPPLQDLAEMNLLHWQSSSDQRNALRFARFGMLYGTGLPLSELEKEPVVGPNFMFRSMDPAARFGFVETSGAPIRLGEEDLKRIEERMQILGMRPLLERTADNTATGQRADERKTETVIQAWIRSLEDMLKAAYKAAATWISATLPEDFGIDIFSEFGTLAPNAPDVDTLLAVRAAGDLTRVTLLRELQRRGILPDRLDVEAEADDAEMEAGAAAEAAAALSPFGDPTADPLDPNADPTMPIGDPNSPTPPTPPLSRRQRRRNRQAAGGRS